MGNPVVHFEISCKEAEAGQGFYRDLFGWKINSDNPWNYGLVDTESETGIGGGVTGVDPAMSQPGVMIYVEVEDLQATLDKAESLGGKTAMPIMEIPGMVTLAHFSDPDGNVIGIVKSAEQS